MQQAIHYRRWLGGLAAWLGFMALAVAGEVTNKYGITMVDIPAGSFQMGSCKVPEGKAGLDCGSPDPDASDRETPLHRVSIKAFQVGKTEVTVRQFERFAIDAGRKDLLKEGSDFWAYNSATGGDYAAVMVSWHDAQAFIEWLNKTDGGGWRLPSEAEWEYACRAGGRDIYCGGSNLDALGWHSGNSGQQQHKVAQKRPNAFGLYDMTGNVWEWVQDCRHDSYRGAPIDGSAWTSNCIDDWRVVRGGSWKNNAGIARAANRTSGSPGARAAFVGFRLARTR